MEQLAYLVPLAFVVWAVYHAFLKDLVSYKPRPKR